MRSRALERVLAPALITALVGAILVYALVLRHGWVLNVLVIVAGGVVLTLASWVLRDHAAELTSARWFGSQSREESVMPTQLDYRMVRLRRDLRDTIERRDRVDAIQPTLRELAAERLASHHGVDLDSDDPRAAQLLGESLHDYLTTRPSGTGRVSRRTIQSYIQRIEEL